MPLADRSERIDPRRLLGAFAILAAVAIYAFLPRRSATRDLPALRVDPNTAPREVLVALPTLGPARARAIEEARAKAPFRSLDDLDRRVKGIGPEAVAELKPFLRFDTKPTPSP